MKLFEYCITGSGSLFGLVPAESEEEALEKVWAKTDTFGIGRDVICVSEIDFDGPITLNYMGGHVKLFTEEYIGVFKTKIF